MGAGDVALAERVRRPAQARSQQSLDRMLRAAESLIARDGVPSLTIAEVVRRAKSSNGAFYARFADKDALVREVQDRFLGEVERKTLAALAALQAERADVETAARRMTRAVCAIFREHGALIGAFVRGSGRDDVLLDRAVAGLARMAEAVVGLLGDRVAGGPIAAETAFRLAVATLEQYVSVAEPARWTDWDTLCRELEQVVTKYLVR